MNIGNAVRYLRRQKGYTQAQLADFAHTTKSTISSLESGQQGYSPALLQHLATALDCPISRIFLIAEKMSECPQHSPIDILPTDVLFDSLSDDMQKVVHQLIRQLLLEKQHS